MEGINIISSEFLTLEMDEDGRGFHVRLDEGIKPNPHHRELKKFVKKILKQGVTRYNADHIGFSNRDRSISLTRGNRRIDLAYYQDGIFYECELKTGYELGLDRIWPQIREQSRFCKRLTLLVPRNETARAEQLVRTQNLTNVYVQSYD